LQVDFGAGLTQTPLEFWITIVFGLAVASLALRRSSPTGLRAFFFCLGHTIVLTAPLFALLEVTVYGDFPTIDKQGSLLFYLDGVHQRLTFSPIDSLTDPAAQLIGVHVGHLWMVAALDLFFSPHGAFNGLAILFPALAWWSCALLLREFRISWDWALAIALPFGLGLHVFRDLNWYTIEKAAIFWLPLFMIAIMRAYRQGGRWPIYSGVCFVLMAFTNWYLALVSALGLAIVQLIMFRDSRLWKTSIVSALMALPLVALQIALMDGAALSEPEVYLEQRAALDIFSFAEFEWNRLPLWRAVELVAFCYGLISIYRYWANPLIRLLSIVAFILLLFSVGPNIYGELPNPVFMATWHVVPGFWRVAKPEVFFYGTWLLTLTCCAYGIAKNKALSTLSKRQRAALYCLSFIWWLIAVRGHESFPGFSTPLDVELGEVWRAHLN